VAQPRGTRIWGTLDPFLESGDAMGRTAANAGFLRGLLAADPFDAYHFFLPDRAAATAHAALLAKEFPALHRAGKFRVAERLALPAALAEVPYHCFHLSDCIAYPAYLARLRNLSVKGHARDIFPITGTTHSLSYARYTRDFLAHLWPGCTARDCVVATSASAQQVVEGFHAALRDGFGLDPQHFPAPRVERIPLGVDPAALAPAAPAERAALRRDLGLAEGEALVLVFARLSHDSKLDLLPVLRAFSRLFAAGVDPASVRLGLAGWTVAGDSYLDTVLGLAAKLGVRCLAAARPDEAAKVRLFRAADIFLSPVDNVQETFGLTLLEAAAVGLPTVASDWDGYRDLVVPGETGLLVPTLGPSSTGDLDALAPLCFDNHSHLLLAQQTVVDVPALAEALGRLLADPGERERMGRAGRERVEREFSWHSVVRGHLDLWERLRAEPVDRDAVRGAVHPMQLPYSRVFAGHPSGILHPDLPLRRTRAGEALYRGQEHPVLYAPLEGRIEPEELRRLLLMARTEISAGDLLRKARENLGLPAERAEALVLYALKHDYLERAHA
jgi:glycosyltransferase involved in cell wall biosynthesis